MAKYSRSVVKKKAAKAPAKKAVVKKKASGKKTSTAKKSAVAKKKTVPGTRKPASRSKTTSSKKTIRRKAVVATRAKQNTKTARKKSIRKKVEPVQPIAEERNEVADNIMIDIPGMDKKSLQRAAVRNYDNHHIRLSNRKGGIKPTGKKPLW